MMDRISERNKKFFFIKKNSMKVAPAKATSAGALSVILGLDPGICKGQSNPDCRTKSDNDI